MTIRPRPGTLCEVRRVDSGNRQTEIHVWEVRTMVNFNVVCNLNLNPAPLVVVLGYSEDDGRMFARILTSGGLIGWIDCVCWELFNVND